MQKKSFLLVLATMAAVVAGLSFGTRGRAADSGASAKPAPTWELKDVDGNVVRSDQFDGKVLVIDFWATWCGPCRVEIPGYIKLQKKYADRGLAIVGISLDQQGPGVVKRFMAQNGIDYQIVMGNQAIAKAFGGIEAIPTTFIIDREGNIRERKVGAMETERFEQLLLTVLGG